MLGDYFEDFIPEIYKGNLELLSARDMVFLGKDNLQLLARFWEHHIKNLTNRLQLESDFEKREKLERRIASVSYMARELRRMSKDADSKPLLFVKPTLKASTRVVIFLENPARFVPGVIAKIVVDEESQTGIFYVRSYGGNHELIAYEPDGFSIFLADDFEYFKRHQRYFGLYLSYYADTVPERDKVMRMLDCLSSQPDPPPAA